MMTLALLMLFGWIIIFLVPIMLLIVAAQIGGWVECEKAGGTYTCIKSK